MLYRYFYYYAVLQHSVRRSSKVVSHTPPAATRGCSIPKIMSPTQYYGSVPLRNPQISLVQSSTYTQIYPLSPAAIKPRLFRSNTAPQIPDLYGLWH